MPQHEGRALAGGTFLQGKGRSMRLGDRQTSSLLILLTTARFSHADASRRFLAHSSAQFIRSAGSEREQLHQLFFWDLVSTAKKESHSGVAKTVSPPKIESKGSHNMKGKITNY